MLDSGEVVTARPGDILIQNGVNKAMQNRGQVPVHIGVVMCAATADGADASARASNYRLKG